MKHEWPTCTVAQLVDAGILAPPVDGNHGELHPKSSDFCVSGVPFIMAADLKEGRVDTVGCSFIPEALAHGLRKGFAKTGDVLLSHKGTMGRTAIVGPLSTPFIVLTPQVTYYRVQNDQRLDRRYLRFYFDGPEFQGLLHRWANKGSTRAYLGITAQLELPVILPPIEEQRRIAEILGSLDDKIELNRRMNETIEAMARALFKSWFVDFDPVRAKAVGRTPPGLDPATAALFPSEFQDSELGKLPRGWSVGSLAEVAELNPESWSTKNAPPTVNYVDLSSTKWGQIESTTLSAWADAPSRARRVLRPGDSVVGTVRPGNGSYALITDEGLTGSTGFAVLRPKAQDGIGFVYLAATSKHSIESLTRLADGGAYPAVRAEDVAATPVVIPDDTVMPAFDNAARPLFLAIARNSRESVALARVREALLPGLLSGELETAHPVEQTAEATT